MERNTKLQLSPAERDSKNKIELARAQVAQAQVDLVTFRQNADVAIEAELAKFPNLRMLEGEVEEKTDLEIWSELRDSATEHIKKAYPKAKLHLETMSEIFRQANPEADHDCVRNGECFLLEFKCLEELPNHSESEYSDDEWISFRNLMVSKDFSVKQLINSYLVVQVLQDLSQKSNTNIEDLEMDLGFAMKDDFFHIIHWFENL